MGNEILWSSRATLSSFKSTATTVILSCWIFCRNGASTKCRPRSTRGRCWSVQAVSSTLLLFPSASSPFPCQILPISPVFYLMLFLHLTFSCFIWKVSFFLEKDISLFQSPSKLKQKMKSLLRPKSRNSKGEFKILCRISNVRFQIPFYRRSSVRDSHRTASWFRPSPLLEAQSSPEG